MLKKSAVLLTVLAAGSFSLSLSAWGRDGQAIGNNEPTSKVYFHQFMPDNDLGTEDSGFMSNISEDQFNAIIDAAYKVFKPYAAHRNEVLQINRNWNDSTVNANCNRSSLNNGKVTINMYGGLARRDEVTPEGFALVLCHELGHAYGGTPYIRPNLQIAAEGQADYFGAQTCLKAVLAYIPDSQLNSPDEYVQDRCRSLSDSATCLRQMGAGSSLGSLLAAMKHESVPDYQTPDQTVVPQTLTSYPKTTQCRLDTYHNGILGLGRPACWFKN